MKSGGLKSNWWKLLGVVILFYVLLAGLLVPLKPGIISVEPSRAVAGDSLWLSIEGYNTHMGEETAATRAWLKLDSVHAIAALRLQHQFDQQMRLFFVLPEFFPNDRTVNELSLIVDSPVDGAYLMPSAVFATQDTIYTEKGVAFWSRDIITGLHEIEGIRFPYRNILYETIRNTYFHVPMWFGMIILFFISAFDGIRYLRGRKEDADTRSSAFATVGLLYGILGIVTGGIWAQYTWGEFWSFDIKQNVAAIALLIYLAYFVLRGSFSDPDRKAVLSASYNIFAFSMLIPLLFIIPRMTDSLHPGSGGNPAMGGEDLDNTMRLVFYPAVVGWTLLGAWIAQLIFRYRRLKINLGD